jgi:hypothetical protein
MGTRTKQGAVAALLFVPSALVILHRSFTNRFRKVRGRLLPSGRARKLKLEKLNASAALPCQWACPDSPLIRGLRISILQQRLGCWASQKLFEKKAASNWQLVLSQKGPVLGPWQRIVTLCRLGLGLGLGHLWATLGPPKGHPSVTQGSPKDQLTVRPLFSTKARKRPGGGPWLKDAGRGVVKIG